MAARVTYLGIEQFSEPTTGVPRVTYLGIEQFSAPTTGVPRVTYLAIEMLVDLGPSRTNRFGVAA